MYCICSGAYFIGSISVVYLQGVRFTRGCNKMVPLAAKASDQLLDVDKSLFTAKLTLMWPFTRFGQIIVM